MTSSYLSVRLSVSPSVRPSAWSKYDSTRGIFMKFNIAKFLVNVSRKLNIHNNLTRITGALYENIVHL